VDPVTDSCVKKTLVSSAGGASRRRTGNDDPAAGLEGPDGMRPGGLAHGLHHHVDSLRQPGSSREYLIGTELEGPVTLASVRLVAHIR